MSLPAPRVALASFSSNPDGEETTIMTKHIHGHPRWHRLPLYRSHSSEATTQRWSAPRLRLPALPKAHAPFEDFRVVALRTVAPAIYDPSWIPTVRIVVLWVLLVVIIMLSHPAVGVCLS